jgi:hypothetical protein
MIDIFYYADFYAIGLLLTFITIFIIRAVRGGVRGRRIAGSWAYFFGAFIAIALAFHVAENIWRIIPGTPVTDAAKPEYNFRWYALILFGVVMLVQGVSIMKAARRLAFGGEKARGALLRHTLIVLALVVPLIPLQVFAALITVFGVINLAVLALFSRKTAGDDARVLSADALLQPKQLSFKINKAA